MKNLSFLNKGICGVSIIFVFILSGCRCYYESLTSENITPQQIKNYYSSNKYLILHRDTSTWHLTSLQFDGENITGKLSKVPDKRLSYQIFIPDKPHRYKIEDKPEVLDQIHFYLKDSMLPEFDTEGHIKFSLNHINKTEIYKKDVFRTTLSWVLPPVIIVGVTGIIIYSSLRDLPFYNK